MDILGSFVDEAHAKVAQARVVPAGYWIDWGGQFENLERASQRLALIIPVVAILVGILLFLALGSVGEALLVFVSRSPWSAVRSHCFCEGCPSRSRRRSASSPFPVWRR